MSTPGLVELLSALVGSGAGGGPSTSSSSTSSASLSAPPPSVVSAALPLASTVPTSVSVGTLVSSVVAAGSVVSSGLSVAGASMVPRNVAGVPGSSELSGRLCKEEGGAHSYSAVVTTILCLYTRYTHTAGSIKFNGRFGALKVGMLECAERCSVVMSGDLCGPNVVHRQCGVEPFGG